MKLTLRQSELLECIARCRLEEKSPVVSELARAMGYRGQSSVTPMLEALKRKGLIEVLGGVRGRQRQILLTAAGKVWTQKPGLPVVGSIAAGPLGEALQNADVFIEALHDLLPFEAGDFLLEVQGDSMIGDGIFEGDRVLLRPAQASKGSIQNGEIVAVQVGDEYSATLKRLYFQSGGKTIELRASNPKYAPLVLAASEVRIAGVFRGLVRSTPRARRAHKAPRKSGK